MSDVEALAEVLLASWRSQGMLHPPFDSDHDDAVKDAEAILASDWLAAYVAAERDRAVREASDYDFGTCVCGRAIVKHKSREGYWHVNGSLRFDHDTALRAALPDDREGETP